MKKLMENVAELVSLYKFLLQALTVHMRDFAWKLLFLLSEGLYTPSCSCRTLHKTIDMEAEKMKLW